MKTLSHVPIVVAAVILVGCGNETKKSAEQQSSNLKQLSVAYLRYSSANRGKPPANEQQLRQYLSSRPPEELKAMGIENVDSLFISPRVQQPYRLNFNSGSKAPPSPGALSVFAYEQKGLDGRRYVAGTLGQVQEVDETRFKELVPNP